MKQGWHSKIGYSTYAVLYCNVMQDEELVRSVDQLCWLSARAGARRKSFGADLERGVRKGKKKREKISQVKSVQSVKQSNSISKSRES